MREQIDEISLDLVRVLVFVDENKLKLPPINFAIRLFCLNIDHLFCSKFSKSLRVRRLLLFFVALPNVLNPFQ